MKNAKTMFLPILVILLSCLSPSCASSNEMVIHGEDTELRDQLRRKGKKESRNLRQTLRHKGRLKGQIKNIKNSF